LRYRSNQCEANIAFTPRTPCQSQRLGCRNADPDPGKAARPNIHRYHIRTSMIGQLCYHRHKPLSMTASYGFVSGINQPVVLK
jgi:hypothetical protein